jgi:hypothetical protein
LGLPSSFAQSFSALSFGEIGSSWKSIGLPISTVYLVWAVSPATIGGTAIFIAHTLGSELIRVEVNNLMDYFKMNFYILFADFSYNKTYWFDKIVIFNRILPIAGLVTVGK